MAARLCRLLVDRGETLESLDTGLAGKVFRPPELQAGPDGAVEVQEVYHRAIEVMEGEIFPLGDISPREERKLFAYQAWRVGFRVPWLLYDGDVRTRGDVDARLGVQRRIADLREDAAASGEGERGVSRGLFLYAKELLPTLAASPEMPLLLAIQEGAGDCTENGMLLYGMMRMAGLDARFAVVWVDSFGDRERHLAAAANVDGEWQVADPVPPYDAFPARHQRWEVIPPLSALFVHLRNRYFDLTERRDGEPPLPAVPAALAFPFDPPMWYSIDPTFMAYFQ